MTFFDCFHLGFEIDTPDFIYDEKTLTLLKLHIQEEALHRWTVNILK